MESEFVQCLVNKKNELSSAISLVFAPQGMCLPVITAMKLPLHQTKQLDGPSLRCWDKPLPVKNTVKMEELGKRVEKYVLSP
jgi:hypothetical protein